MVVGIAVGVPLAALILFAILFTVFIFPKLKKKQEEA